MKSELDKTVKVQKSGDVKNIAKLRMELERLKKGVGGKDKIVPNEGIVFTYKGGTYKLTGTFIIESNIGINVFLNIFPYLYKK